MRWGVKRDVDFSTGHRGRFRAGVNVEALGMGPGEERVDRGYWR